jgi:hypothetical protein
MYICSNRNLYVWTYISSIEYVYKKLVETKKIELKRNHKRRGKHKRNEKKKEKKTFIPGW